MVNSDEQNKKQISPESPVKQLGVVFFATPDIALTSFEALIKSPEINVLALVSQTPRPSGRGKKISEHKIVQIAKENNIEVLQTEKIAKDVEIIERLKQIKPDFFVTFAFAQILSQEILDIPKFCTLNIHPSLLPKYRGSNPIATALLHGDKKTGITIAKTVLALDEGDIVLQVEIALDDAININDLKEKITEIAPKLLLKALFGIKNGEISPIKQDEKYASYTKKIQKSDKIICFDKDCCSIHNQIRALLGDFTCQVKFNDKIIKIIKSSYFENDFKDANKGEVLEISKQGILVKCAKGAILFEIVKPEGKNEMPAYAFAQGHKIKKGDKFES